MTAILFCPACDRQREVVFQDELLSKAGAKQSLQIYRCPDGHEVRRRVGMWRQRHNKRYRRSRT